MGEPTMKCLKLNYNIAFEKKKPFAILLKKTLIFDVIQNPKTECLKKSMINLFFRY